MANNRRLKITGIFYSFTLVSLCWVFFRAVSLRDAFTVIHRIFSPGTPWKIEGEFEERTLLLYSLFGISSILILDIQKEFFSKKKLLLYHNKMSVRLATCITLVVIILSLGVFDGSQFIYFQF